MDNGLQARGPESQSGVDNPLVRPGHRCQHQVGDDRRRQQRLPGNHRQRSEEQAEIAEGPLTTEQAEQQQADNHRRQRHEGVEQGDQQPPTAKAADPQPQSGWNPKQRCQNDGTTGGVQRGPDRHPDFPVEAENQLDSREQ